MEGRKGYLRRFSRKPSLIRAGDVVRVINGVDWVDSLNPDHFVRVEWFHRQNY